MKKILQFAIPTAAVFGALGYSKYCTLPGTLFFGGLFAWFWFKKTQLLDFFLPDWEGEVVEKIARRDKKPKVVLPGAIEYFPAYNCVLTVKRNCDGKLFKSKFIVYECDGFSTDIKYFRHGETVRHHRCLPLYEKFDKSKERKLLCFKCGRFVDKYEEKCWHCGLPVLSEEMEYVKKTHTLFEGEKRSDRIW